MKRGDALAGNRPPARKKAPRSHPEESENVRGTELTAVLALSPFMLTRCGRDLRYRFVSDAYAAMLGRRPEDVAGKPIVDVIGPRAFDAIRPYIEQVLAGRRVEYESELPLAGVGPRFLRAIYTPERDRHGNVDGWVASVLDVGEQKRADQARQQLARIVDSSDDAIVSKDLDGVIVSWNRGAERVFGYTSEEAVGRPITLVIPAELQDEEPHILARIRHGENIDHYETVRQRKDGELIHVSLTVSPVRNAAGNVVGASKIARDITVRKRAEERIAADLEAMTRLRQLGGLCMRDGDRVDKCLHEIVDTAIAIAGADKGNLQLLDPMSGALVTAAERGFAPLSRQFLDNLDDAGLARGAIMCPARPVIVEDVMESGILRGEPSRKAMLDAGVRAIVAMPLTSSAGTLIGMISTHFGRPHRPSERVLGLLELLVRQSADYLERRRAESTLARRVEEQTALYRITTRLYRAETPADVHEAALDAILGALHCRRASILHPDHQGVMRFAGSRGLSERCRRAVEGYSPWAPDETSPEPVCIADVAGADLPEPLKQVLTAEGVAAFAFIPLVAQGRLAGEFMAYHEAPHAFARDEIDLALNLAHQLGLAVERMQAEGARQAAERELRQLSERLEFEVERRTLERDRIWNVSEDLLGVSNFAGYFININPAWTKLLGWSEDEIKSLHVSELRHPDDAEHSEAGRALLAEGVSTARMENRFRHKDGSWRWIQWTMTAENGLIYVSGRHVTAEKESATALAQAQRQSAHLQKMEALGQLTGGVAHDFNNLLMVVSGQAQMLRRRLTEPRDLRALEAIQIASTRGEGLTRQLLSFARSQPLSPTVISPAETVDAIREVLAGSLHVNIELSIDVPQTIWPIRVDKSEIELALVNLAVNARDAMPGGGRLSISAANVRLTGDDNPDGLAGEFVALSAADTGGGIADDILPRVFEPFFTTKGVEKGTGLGLSQVYGFARRSGGTVAIKSRLLHGTTVTIYLPPSHARIERPAPENRAGFSAPSGARVLVVEDNPEVRAVAVTLLEQLGYQTVAVDAAAAAFEALDAGPAFSLVFTDVVLPGDTDGLMLAQSVKDRYPGLPVVLTTGYAKVFDADSEFPVLRKPYQIATLERVVREALDDPEGTGDRPASLAVRAAGG